MADDDQNSMPETTPSAVPDVAAKGAVAETNTAKTAKPGTKSRSKLRQKGAKGKRSAKKRAIKLKESDNRFTSSQMVHAVEESFGRIGFDPCWHEASAVKPNAYLDIRRGQDGLTDLWQGPLAFVNPPWSLAKKFIERAYDEWKAGRADTILCLVPSKTDTTFFHTVLKTEADVYFVEKRLRFSKEDGTSTTTAEAVMIIMFGATEMEKVRFAARVPGSWWLPDKALRSRPARDPFSCSAVTPLDGRHSTVFCTRIGAEI